MSLIQGILNRHKLALESLTVRTWSRYCTLNIHKHFKFYRRMIKMFVNKTIHFFTLVFTTGILVTTQITLASESDVYTYSDIALKDASTEINRQLNRLIDEGGHEIAKQLRNPHGPGLSFGSDNEIEYRFMEYYNSYRRVAPWASSFENCIITQKCPGWSPVEEF